VERGLQDQLSKGLASSTALSGSEYKKWTNPIIGLRPAGDLRLLFFPFAGGGASAFSAWQSCFPASIETYSLQYPGRESRWGDATFGTLNDLVVALADELIPHVAPPFAFLGHSLGGLVAFELTRLLRQRGWTLPTHLFLAAVRPPRLQPRGQIHKFSDERFLKELRTYNGLPKEILENREFLDLLLPMIRDDFRLYEQHVSIPGEPLPVPITVLAGLQDEKARPSDMLGWSSETSAAFHTHFLPGRHFFLFDSRAEIARVLLDEIHGTVE
jgi:surfactin synthase thioesterase subunit